MFTIFLGAVALILILMIFYRLTHRELTNRNLYVQIRAAADVYDSLIDINLTNDTYYILHSFANNENIDKLYDNVRKMIKDNIDVHVKDSSKLYLTEFMDLSTLNERLSNVNVLTVEFLNSEDRWCRGRFICAERNSANAVTRVLWGIEIVDEEKRQKERLQHLAETDLMTGLYNRVTGEHKTTELLNGKRGGMFALIDIDGFKKFNDQYGHDIGDQVIISVANCLKNAFRNEDIVMRLGGDEFAVFASGVCTQEIGNKIFNRFYDNISNISFEEQTIPKITVSTGAVFVGDENQTTFLDLYKIADQNMYESKKSEDKQIVFDSL